jgi:cytosine/adenosine deaminase-related metal-dependent hydrolase
VLVDVVRRAGQRAYVGKVSMDRNSPDYLIETTGDAMRDAEAFAKVKGSELTIMCGPPNDITHWCMLQV